MVGVDEIRRCFELAVKEVPQFADSTPLGAMEVNGVFSHYMDADTDTMFIGFALGMRYHERLVQIKESE